MSSWFVYIVKCSDNSLYTGIAVNVERRIKEHNENDLLSAKYTRMRRPVNLVYKEEQFTRSNAAKREYEIKQLSRIEKKALVIEGLKA